MGLCVSYDEMVVGYKGEDYIRDVLRAFKSRQFPIETLQEQLYSLKEQSDRLTFIYESIVNKDDNKFQKLNEAIINIINNTKQFDNDQFTVIKLITVSLKTNNKIYFIKDFFKVKNFDTLYSICKIIWKVNLIGFTQAVYDNIEEKEFLKDYEKLEKMQILEKREDKICFSEASYALLIYFVNKEERTLDHIKEVIGI